MKTTLNIDDTVMQRLREEAARRGTTMSALVEAALRSVLARPTPSDEPKGAVEERLTEALAEEAKIQDLMKEGKELIRVAPPQERGELGRILGQNGRQLARVRARIRRFRKELEKTDLKPLEPGPSKAKDFDNAPPDTLPPLPTWRSGGFRVDIANREELYRVMEEE